jgi:tol-pal system protein YbgF
MHSVFATPRARPGAFRFITLAAAIAATLHLPGAAAQDVPVIEAGYGENVEARLQKLEQSLQGRGLLDLANQVEALQRQVQQLRGQVEQQQYVIDQLQARAAQQPPAAVATTGDPRWPSPAAPAPAAPGAAVPPAPVTAPPVNAAANAPSPSPADAGMQTAPAPAAPGAAAPAPATQTATAAPPIAGDPDQAYSAAFNSLKGGKYQDAVAQFNNFLVTYPDSPRADSAQYWLGEAYYVNRQFDQAINEYQKLVAAYPSSQKVSQAMLKIGFCQQELGQTEQARATLQEVLQRYPGTTSARMAEDRLQRMRLEQAP